MNQLILIYLKKYSFFKNQKIQLDLHQSNEDYE